jgi:hypothetical protein
MTDLAGMPSYFWLTSSRLRERVQDDVLYTTQALRQDLRRVRNAWDECQGRRERDAIYSYLTALFDLVAWWALKALRWNEPERRCGYVVLSRPITTNHSPPSSCAPPIRQKLTSARDRNGLGCCGTRSSTSRAVNRLPLSFRARAASINVLSVLLDTSGGLALRANPFDVGRLLFSGSRRCICHAPYSSTRR